MRRAAVGPLVLVPVLTIALAGCTAEADADRDGPAAPASADVDPPDSRSAQPVTEEETLDLTRRSIDDPRSTWVVVNKRRGLRPPTYTPELAIVEGYLVHPGVVRPLTRLLAAGRRHGLDLRIMSAYRSYGRQAQLYAGAVAARGAERAARTTAPAGHSEHQTGLAVDLGRASTGACNVAPCFAATREGRWLRRHAHRFGFVLRYPRGSRSVTGYAHESWHFRFVGRALATHLRRERTATLEDAFGLVGGGS